MDIPLIGSLEHWHDFYTLTGSASATLVGLMFVAVSISDGAFSRQDSDGYPVLPFADGSSLSVRY
jgi:hypothetical protein